MNYGKLFAAIMIALQVAACCAYASQGDYRRAIYWAAATVLTGSVTF
jgi:hypothetical protein